MKSFIFTKRYNMPMVASIMLTVWGVETLFSDHWLIGLLMILWGLFGYLVLDCESADEPAVIHSHPCRSFRVPKVVCACGAVEPTPVETDPVLLPIEWEAAFNEPVPSIPTSLCQVTVKPDDRL